MMILIKLVGIKGHLASSRWKGCVVERGEVPKRVAYSAGFARTSCLPSLFNCGSRRIWISKERSHSLGAISSLGQDSPSPARPFGSQVGTAKSRLRLGTTLCWSLGVVPLGHNRSEKPAALCWTGIQAGRTPAANAEARPGIGLEPRSQRGFLGVLWRFRFRRPRPKTARMWPI